MIRSFRTSKATAPPRHLARLVTQSTALSRRCTAGSARSNGTSIRRREGLRSSASTCRRNTRHLAHYRVSIKGPLSTRSAAASARMNVTLRQVLDLYACVRPVRYFDGVPSPSRNRRGGQWSSSARTPKTLYAASSGRRVGPVQSGVDSELHARAALPPGSAKLRHRHQAMSEFGSKRLVRKAIE